MAVTPDPSLYWIDALPVIVGAIIVFLITNLLAKGDQGNDDAHTHTSMDK